MDICAVCRQPITAQVFQKFFVKDQLTVRDMFKTHDIAVDTAKQRMMSKGVHPQFLKHVYDDGDNDEFVLYGDWGYHIEAHFTSEGRMDIRVSFGEFVPSNTGRRWVEKEESGIWKPM